jgi:hypothetical protein
MGVSAVVVGGALIAESANQSARASDDAGKAGWYAARTKKSQADANYQTVKGIVDEATVSGLASFDKDIERQEKNLARQEKLISEIDPTVIEASQQALKLLRGEQAASLGPLKNQRAQQRQKLLNTLREQLGPGAETSTAGIQALTRFDAETDSLFSNAQQSAIAGLGQTAGQFNSMRPDMLREGGALSAYGQGKTNLKFNQARALEPQLANLMGVAGGENVWDMSKAQGAMGQAQAMGQIGGSVMGMGVGSFGGGGGMNFGSMFSSPSGGVNNQPTSQPTYNYGSQDSYLGGSYKF